MILQDREKDIGFQLFYMNVFVFFSEMENIGLTANREF